jgi:hypothetical protein
MAHFVVGSASLRAATLGGLLFAAGCSGAEPAVDTDTGANGGASAGAGMPAAGTSGAGVTAGTGAGSGGSDATGGKGAGGSAEPGGGAGNGSSSGGANTSGGAGTATGGASAAGTSSGGRSAGISGMAGMPGGATSVGGTMSEGGSTSEGGAGGTDAAGSSGTSAGGTGAEALSFATDIWPMFEMIRDPVFVYRGMGSYESCVTTGVCHGGAAPGARLGMIDAESAYSGLIGVASESELCAGTVRVVPGDPDVSCLILFYEGRLRDDLEWVDTAEIDRVREWIAGGALP